MDQSNRKAVLSSKLNSIDKQITILTELKKKCLNQLNALNYSQDDIQTTVTPTYLSLDGQVALFKSYFRGREDVYAKFWVNNRTGKRGYSPTCKNEWVRSLCRKGAVKCSECPNQEFIPFNENAIRRHLSGECIIGVYPMLKNDNCYFLAIDFDKENWLDDIAVLKDICSEEGISVAIERSRSGKGGHIWIFFGEEIPAALARRLGTCLITKAMARRYQIDMKSYDRLFPNQDVMPKGGFGNLIALPFQKEAVNIGNSVFIDGKGVAYKDQWAYLATVGKMSYKDVQKVVDEAMKNGQIIGIRNSPIDEHDEPWMRLPSGKRRFKVNIKELPASIETVLANRIYIKIDKAPSVLLNQLKHLAAFHNPEFYKKQKMRFSTHATPRVICCAEIVDNYLSLPRGCLEDAEALLKEYDIKLHIEDKRTTGKKVNFKFAGNLNPEQQKALKSILSEDFGVLVAPPGAGKTVLAIAAIAKRKTNVLILVHRKPLMDQWRLQLSALLRIDKKEIGQIGAGKNNSTGIIDVAMVQSMDFENGVDDRIADYGFVIIDECHHVSAFSFEKVLTQAKAKYVLGLTATPYRRDGHQPIIHMQCGPICHQIKQGDLSAHISGSMVMVRKTNFSCEWTDDSKIYELWNKLIDSEERNQMILQDVLVALDEGRFPLILTERREHFKRLETLLQDKVDFLAPLYGGMRQKGRREIFDRIKECPDNCRKVILATGSYIGEGFDEPRLDTLFLTMPSSFKGKIVQYTGRLHRYHKDKQDIRVYDYVDENMPVLERMHQKRLKTYKMLGYEVVLS